jgi:trimeric autotransporter adhesin
MLRRQDDTETLGGRRSVSGHRRSHRAGWAVGGALVLAAIGATPLAPSASAGPVSSAIGKTWSVRRVPAWVPTGAVANDIYTIAGDGNPGTPTGSDGDGGPAAAAQLNAPRQMVESVNGDLFIADTGNNRVRRVDHATGIITTVVGNGNPGTPTGDDGDGGPATAALLNGPKVLALYNGGLFITDNGNNRVRRVDLRTGIITTVAGDGNPGTPTGNDGDGGPATAAQLASANWLTVDTDGDVLIADTNDNRIRLVAAGQRHSPVFGAR